MATGIVRLTKLTDSLNEKVKRGKTIACGK
jgi:hypothetical protein